MSIRAVHCTQWGACTVIALLLVAATCGLGQAKVQIEIWGNSFHLNALQPLIDEYNASQSEIEVIIPGKGESPDTIFGAALAGTLPAILETGRLWTNQYARAGFLVELEPFIAREPEGFLADFVPATLYSDNAVDGRIYSLPIHLNSTVLYYNPVLFDQAGVAYPQSGWTWTDLQELGHRLRRYNADGEKEIHGIVSEHPMTFDWTLLAQAGGSLIDDTFQVTVNSVPVRTTYNYILNLIDLDILAYDFQGAAGARFHHAGLLATGNWRQDHLDTNESPMVLAPPLRHTAASEPVTRFADRGWAIMNVSQEEQDAAWEVIKHLTSPEVSARWNIALGYPPATFSAIAHPDFQEFALHQQPNVGIWANEYLSVPHATPWPIPMYQTAIWDVAGAQQRPLVNRQISLEGWVTEFERQLEVLVQEFHSIE